ncbi:hypothetical protein GCM10027615_52120 [Plantactinospora veratri]
MLVNEAIGTRRSAADSDQIRRALQARFDELTAEYDETLAQSQVLRLVEVGDTAGDDQADSGTKTAERDTAQSLLRTILDRRAQFEHALSRLAEGTYGWCEGAATRSRWSGWKSSPPRPPASPASSPGNAGRPDRTRPTTEVDRARLARPVRGG